MYRFIFSLAFLILVQSCDDIPRDNLLDPKNSDGHTEAVVLIETFVNTSADIPFDYNYWALAGLENVQSFYPDEVIVVEYHRDVQTYDDDFNTIDSNIRYTQLHQAYTFGEVIPMGVPDIFINGSDNRISGASAAAVVEEKVRSVAADILNDENYFKIEIETEMIGASSIKVSAQIAAMGNKSASDISARLIFLKDYQDFYHKRVVLDLVDNEPLEDIDKGSYIEKEFDSVNLSDTPDRVVLAILSEDGTEVLQSAIKEL